VHWYQKAARQRVVKAQHVLCLSYALGRGTKRDRVRAYAWCQIAAEQGLEEADETLESLRPFMTPRKLEIANTLAEALREEIKRGGAAPAPKAPHEDEMARR
jgi:TPR repeat protein